MSSLELKPLKVKLPQVENTFTIFKWSWVRMNMKKTVRTAFLATLCLIILCMPIIASASLEKSDAGTLEAASGEPDLVPTAIHPYHYKWVEKAGKAAGDPYFNCTNYVNVSVENKGSGDSGSFRVCLYADGELIGEKTISGLAAGSSTEEKFEWVPIGEDPLSWTDTEYGSKISYTDTEKTYILKVVVDETKEISEGNEENNNLTTTQTVIWNGYIGDEPLQNYISGFVRGGMLYTTGDGVYRTRNTNGTVYGTYSTSAYKLEIPGNPILSRLYIYYTWGQDPTKAPKLGVTLTTPSGTHTLTLDKGYNDYKGEFGIYRYPWGTYAYDISEYVTESGNYSVSITNLNDGTDEDFCSVYAYAAPAILTVYENNSMPIKEYWINEGADILLGGNRDSGGYLSYKDCMNNATFPGSVSPGSTATLGIVSPWADYAADDFTWFNGYLLGEGIYRGNSAACTLEDGPLKMVLGRSSQVSINVSDVTSDLVTTDNTLVQVDNGDNMMAANAFLLVDYSGTILSLEADQSTVTVGVSTNVTFTVMNGSEPVEGATITLSGCATGTGTTDANGTAVISIKATEEGTINAKAISKEGFSSRTISMQAEPKEKVASNVSMTVEITPAISLTVSSGNLNFGTLSRGHTSPSLCLNLSNSGASEIKVTVKVSDDITEGLENNDTENYDTGTGLFEEGLLLNSTKWGDYSTVLAANSSNTVDVKLEVPSNYTGNGTRSGSIAFWVEAAE